MSRRKRNRLYPSRPYAFRKKLKENRKILKQRRKVAKKKKELTQLQ